MQDCSCPVSQTGRVALHGLDFERYLEARADTEVVGATNVGGARLARLRLLRATPGPPIDGLIVEVIRRADGQLLRANLGVGPFSFEALEGAGLVVPRGVDVNFDGRGPLEVTSLFMPPNVVHRWSPEKGLFDRVGPLNANAFFDPEVTRVLDALTSPRPVPEVRLEMLLSSLAARAHTLTSFPRSTSRVSALHLAAVVALLRRRLDQRLPLGEAAEIAGVGQRELACAFRATMGQTMNQYCHRLRVHRARERTLEDPRKNEG